MKQNKYTRLFSNTIIFTVGKFVSKLIVIFMLPFYTSYLSAAEYSTSDLITQLCNLIIPIACLGVSEGIFRNAAGGSRDKEAFFTNGVMLMLFGSIGFLALSPLLNLTGYFNDYVWLIILYVLASNIHSVCAQYVCAIGKTKLFSGQGVLNTALTVSLNILFLAGLGMGIEGYVLSIILADFISALFLFFTARLYKAFWPGKINGKQMGELLRFCLPLVPSTVFWWITSVSDRYMVSYFVSDTENGLYSVAYKIPTLLTYVVTIFNDAWKLSAVSDADGEERTHFYSKVFRYYIAIMFMGGVALTVTAQLSSAILFDESYHTAWIFIPVLSAATVFTSLDTFMGSAYFTVKKTSMSLWTSLIGAILNIVLNFLLIPQYGAMGASAATFVSYFAVFLVRALTMKRFIPFKLYPVKLIANTILLAAVTVLMTGWGSTFYGLFASIGVSLLCLIYNGRDLYLGVREALSALRRK